MLFISKAIIAGSLLTVSAFAAADAYVCQLPNKSRVVQSEPCSSSQATLSSAQSSRQSIEEQNANAARANADLKRQTDFFYSQRALEAASKQPSKKQDSIQDQLEDLQFESIRTNNELQRMRQQQNYEKLYPPRR